MNEELKQLEETLKAKEGELQKKEEEIKQREADAENIGATIKAEYEKRLEARNEVIKQLSAGEEKAPAAPTFIERMNEKRKMQNKKW